MSYTFEVTVINEKTKKPFSGAKVSFNGKIHKTNTYGSVILISEYKKSYDIQIEGQTQKVKAAFGSETGAYYYIYPSSSWF